MEASIPLFLKLLFLSLLISCISTLSTEETNAMCKLQSSMLVSKWKTNCSTSACSWSGVHCSSNVTSLELYNFALSGTLPSQIGYLRALNNFDLITNPGLSGTLPTQIGYLTMLTLLSISNTGISGTIPTQTGFLTALSYLSLANIQITGTFPTQMGLLTSLTFLDCHDTPVSGAIPIQFGGMTALKTVSFSNSEICGCFPHQWNKSLTSCDMVDVPNDCNCPLPAICNPNICTPSECGSAPEPGPVPISVPVPVPIPVLGPIPIPVPIPMLIPVPVPIPASGVTPLPSPSIQSTSQPSPDFGCQGNYGTQFTCKDGKWTSSTDVALNGTNLFYSDFNLSTLFVNGNMLISESSIIIENNLFIEKQSVLTLQNCSLLVSGNLYLNPQSTIVVILTNNNFTIHIKHCAFLDGSLVIIIHQTQIGKRFLILTSQCINGTFSSVFVNTDTPQCNVIIPHLEYSQDSLSVSFDLLNHCNSEVQSWIYIVIGIVCLLLLIVIIGSAIIITRNLERRQNNLDKIGQLTKVTLNE